MRRPTGFTLILFATAVAGIALTEARIEGIAEIDARTLGIALTLTATIVPTFTGPETASAWPRSPPITSSRT